MTEKIKDAEVAGSAAVGSGAGQLVAFTLANEEFGVAIGQVREIVRMPDVTPVPHSPEYVAGICNLRGNVLPVLDTRRRFMMNNDRQALDGRLLVVEACGHQTGLIVDNVKEVMQVGAGAVEPPPAVCKGIGQEFLSGVVKMDEGKRLVLVLNLDEVVQIDVQDQKKREVSVEKSSDRVAQQEIMDEEQLVTFKIAQEEYAFQIERVREIFRLEGVTALPNVPSYVKGLYTLRNKLIPILDLRTLLGISSMESEITSDLDSLLEDADRWQASLEQALRNGAAFKGEVAIKGSAFGRWFEAFSTSNTNIQNAIKDLRKEYVGLYAGAQGALRAAQTSTEDAMAVFNREVAPALAAIRSRLPELKKNVTIHMTDDQRVMVVESGEVTVGYLVDSVNEVVRIPKSVIETTPEVARSERKELMGIAKLNEGKRLIMIMDDSSIISKRDEQLLAASAATQGDAGQDVAQHTLKEQAMEEDQLVTFGIGREEYGIPVMEVQEINRLTDVTSVPRAPSFVDGVTNLRGSVVPVINIRKFFGLPTKERDDRTRIIIVDMNGVKTGLCVDQVNEVLRITRSSIEATPAIIASRGENDYMDGVCKFGDGKRMIMIINVKRMLSAQDLSALSSLDDNGTEDAALPPASGASKPKTLKKKIVAAEADVSGDE
ncbi:MAG: chemotaxis protein CheW [FCB group bacterium]|jgi:purine-binding chemotaxis protein CheW|nr:chemotaxis protein CheW [FCB group bacterium]